MGRLKTGVLNLDDVAMNGWMGLHSLLWKFELMPQYYETSEATRYITRLQDNMDLKQAIDKLKRNQRNRLKRQRKKYENRGLR